MQSRSTAVAEQYARALLDVLEERPAREREQCEAELGALAEAVDRAPELRAFLSSPVVERGAKEKAVARALPGVRPITRRFVGVVLSRGRAELLPEVYAAYERLRDERHRVLVADVAAAVPLGRDVQERCAEVLRQATGRQVRLRTARNPSLIGGVRTQIGSRVFDGSVRARLDLLRRRLIGD